MSGLKLRGLKLRPQVILRDRLLIIKYHYQSVAIPYLGHSCKVFPDSGQWILLANLEIDVNQFVRECREFVGEAGLVFSGHVGRKRVAVVLLLDLFI